MIQAAPNHITARGYAAVKKLLGAKIPQGHENSIQYISDEDDNDDDSENIPETFDARSKWPKCPSVNSIKDQSDCGSCWVCVSVILMYT